MSDSGVSHKNSRSVHSADLEQLLLDEFHSLTQSKDTLDADFPSCSRHIANTDMWRIAYLKLMRRLCDPRSGDVELN